MAVFPRWKSFVFVESAKSILMTTEDAGVDQTGMLRVEVAAGIHLRRYTFACPVGCSGLSALQKLAGSQSGLLPRIMATLSVSYRRLMKLNRFIL
jgi:hypothetical protein